MAERLGCRCLGMDMSPEALLVTRSRLKGGNLTLLLESGGDAVPLEGNVSPETGLATLAGFPAAHPAFPAQRGPLDALERWAVGELEGDTLRELAFCQRSFARPELPPLLPAGQPLTRPAVSTVDAAGVYRVYEWRE